MSALAPPQISRPDLAARWERTRARLFSSPFNSAVTILASALILWIAATFLRWAVLEAAWSGGPEECKAHSGACWPFVWTNARLMFFGTYPTEMLWRAATSLVLMFALVICSMAPRLWGRALGLAWIVTPVAVCLLLGGFLSDRTVSTNEWGGLPLTMLIWTIAFAGAFVLAIPLALARRSRMGGVRLASVAFIELVRGVPMLVALYVSRFIVPMAAPGFEVNLFFSVSVALVVFVASYLAEIIRAGIQAIPAGQSEAARALGLGYWRTTQLVILPQALRAVIPALVNLGIGILLSTPLVAVIGMTDFLSAAKEAASHEQEWPGCYNVAYFVIALVFFGICFSASRYSQWLERRLRAGGNVLVNI